MSHATLPFTCYVMSHNNMESGVAALLLAAVVKKKRKSGGKHRGLWQRKWVGQRINNGAYQQLVQELRLSDPLAYRNFLRMDEESFLEVS